jgi:hypothetical protein
MYLSSFKIDIVAKNRTYLKWQIHFKLEWSEMYAVATLLWVVKYIYIYCVFLWKITDDYENLTKNPLQKPKMASCYASNRLIWTVALWGVIYGIIESHSL